MPRRCDRLKKMLFIKIAVSFTSLIPCLILPTDDRETTERTPTELLNYKKCYLLRLPFMFSDMNGDFFVYVLARMKKM